MHGFQNGFVPKEVYIFLKLIVIILRGRGETEKERVLPSACHRPNARPGWARPGRVQPSATRARLSTWAAVSAATF